MQQTGNSTRSSFISWAGRFRNIGLVGPAMAVLIGFIEAVAVHASEAAAEDVAAHDHVADILSGVAPNAGHRSNVGASFEGPTHQLSNISPTFGHATHPLSDSAVLRLRTRHTSYSTSALRLKMRHTGCPTTALPLRTRCTGCPTSALPLRTRRTS